VEKNATLNIRINPEVKRSAEKVLSQLGVPMATAIDMFLKQITLTGGIPFAVTLPKAPDFLNADMMSTSQIRDMINEGLSDIASGRVRPAKETFARFRGGYSNEIL
jgi:addiction module RelB/DinJ family antitoxin